MNYKPQQFNLEEWDAHYAKLQQEDLKEPSYGGILSRHVDDGDFRLKKLLFDNSPAALDLWNFLLTEEGRLREARSSGQKIIGTMKDLGTIPVMAYSIPNLTTFYPDGAWWIPCIMELSAGLMDIADSLGIDESFCPVRAMLGAFATEAHFPTPDMLICSVGATCDDFSAIAQRLNSMGHPISWWEIPHRRQPDANEETITLPGGFEAPASQIEFVKSQLKMVQTEIESLAGEKLTDETLTAGIEKTNLFRHKLAELRELTFTAKLCPLPALELLIAEMLSIHFCSDQDEAIRVIDNLLSEVQTRVEQETGFFEPDAVRVFWVNPVADLQAMNLLEQYGGRICGTEYLFSHALDSIPTNIDPLDALAQMALADPMVGSSSDRAERICRDIRKFGAEAVIISRIPGASHCALESTIIADTVASRMDIPTLELEVPPVSEPMHPTLKTRIEGLTETVRGRREQ
jgi:benzoyl-CoA reductase/2-hydroxyglutaryl-CoA dehydratase subunit BcrC/BadD/HgdB